MQIKQIGDHRLLYVMAAAPEYGEHLQKRFFPLMTGIGPVEADYDGLEHDLPFYA